MRYYQVSFTRVINDDDYSKGWNLVNASSSMPGDAIISYINFQKNNINEPSFVDSDIKTKISMEFQ